MWATQHRRSTTARDRGGRRRKLAAGPERLSCPGLHTPSTHGPGTVQRCGRRRRANSYLQDHAHRELLHPLRKLAPPHKRVGHGVEADGETRVGHHHPAEAVAVLRHQSQAHLRRGRTTKVGWGGGERLPSPSRTLPGTAGVAGAAVPLPPDTNALEHRHTHHTHTRITDTRPTHAAKGSFSQKAKAGVVPLWGGGGQREHGSSAFKG
jgi:hypothetical protein